MHFDKKLFFYYRPSLEFVNLIYCYRLLQTEHPTLIYEWLVSLEGLKIDYLHSSAPVTYSQYVMCRE